MHGYSEVQQRVQQMSIPAWLISEGRNIVLTNSSSVVHPVSHFFETDDFTIHAHEYLQMYILAHLQYSIHTEKSMYGIHIYHEIDEMMHEYVFDFEYYMDEKQKYILVTLKSATGILDQ